MNKEMRTFDIVLYGSTGFTGKLVAEYFALNVPFTKVKWAIAGRNIIKLEALKINLIHLNPACSDIGVLECNAGDLKSLEKVTKQTTVIITTVGPFAFYGEKLVKACTRTSTHYCDITGEPEFVKSILRQYDTIAREKNIFIINCCGFDSIPADAGAYFTAMQLPANETKTIKGFVSTNATFSGGTYASAIHAMADIKKNINKVTENTGMEKVKEKNRIKNTIHYDKQLKKWALPMPVIDPWMVSRTAKYRSSVYGENFHYAQFLAVSSLPQVIGVVGTVGMLAIGAQIKPVKNLMLQYRKSGEGPAKEERDKSYFKLIFMGDSETKHVVTKVSGGDPGYTETSKMLSETALTLLENLGSLPISGGVLTPCGALGNLLIDKLQSKGIKFEVVSN